MKLSNFSLPVSALSPGLDALRREVREFLAAERAAGGYARTAAGWDRYDPAFSRKVAARGWIGMTWPARYGGRERSFLERYVVAEELLSAGAPVRAHWLADRQIGPLLLAVGTEAQKRTWLPRIAAGECYFCVGLSEPDSGSDLSSIRTRAVKVEGGWRVTGTKVWTSYAHMAHMMNLFARTSPRSEENRHAGVTQFLVDLKTPGVTIRPIHNLAGDHDFNEVIFDDVLLPEDAVIGKLDGAWSQVTGELAHERSGSERWLNAYGLLVSLIDQAGPQPGAADAAHVGRLVAQLWTLHRMSFSIAGMLQRGEAPDVEAALVKDLGTHFDQEVPAVARRVMPEAARARLGEGHPFNAMLERAQCYAPSHTIRGGTQEILRGIIARGLGLR
ncbi:acyl-CoA dehydrogenase family protein [Pigmentiphaga soli]